MKRLALVITCLSLIVSFSWGQQVHVTGTVTSKDDGEPVIGATILLKGSSTGTITNFDGQYEIDANIGSTLVFSYVGLVTQEVVVKGSTLNVVMASDAQQLEEVVVTAMGVKAEKKKLNFAVQSLNSDAITDGQNQNLAAALQGKISGINVTNSGGSPNAGQQIILRGISSVNSSQSNEPLIILDGMPLLGGASRISDINPNDIANITVLKGAAASALYGQEAANGVIMITTKIGAAGKITVSFNGNFQVENGANLTETQTMYGPGALGFYKPQTNGGWGPPISSGETTYNNIKNFFQTGYYQKYDVNVTGGTERFQTYASANFQRNDGIVANDYLQKIGVLVKSSFEINKYVTVSMMANVVNNQYRGASSASDISTVYNWPITDDITNYKNLDGTVRFRYLADQKENSPYSPLWGRYENSGKNESTRNVLQGNIVITPVTGLQITGRISFDQNNYDYDGYSVPIFDDSVILPELDSDSPTYLQDLAYQQSVPYFTSNQLSQINQNLLGSYSYSQSRSQLLTGSLIATYHQPLPHDFNLNFLAGGEFNMRSSISSSMAGRNFIIPGVYSMQNVTEVINAQDATLNHTRRRMAGAFWEVRGDYNGLATISVTGRWDWSSTIDSQYNPYFYPSVTGGLIFSELFDIANNWFSYGKLRGNWAMVGKDAPAYLFDRKYGQFATLPDGGYGTDPSKSVASNLIPEMSKSWEVGVDLRFFENRTRLDVSYYNTITENQIVTVRVSPTSGHILQTRNEGTIKNHGLEFTLEQEILRRQDMNWTATLNFGLNRGTLTQLPEGMVEIQGTQYGDIFPCAYLNGSTTAISGKDYLRTDDGKVICDENGYPMINPTKSVLIGNREPDFMCGLATNFNYKGFTVSALLDGRLGGDVVNVTARGMTSSGMNKNLEYYRGRQVVWDGVVEQADGTYVQNTTPIVLDYTTIAERIAGVSSNWIEDGSYIRLSYVTVGYDFARLIKSQKLSALRLSLTGSNLFLLTRYSGSDPQLNASPSSGGTGSAGIDNYAVPNTRSFNLSLNVSF